MRLWTLHPRYLDAAGLVALWREALLAQAVLLGKTTGYRQHPQLDRFRQVRSPAGFIAAYLREVHRESLVRGYTFAFEKIGPTRTASRIAVTSGQVACEWRHLLNKLKIRDPVRHARFFRGKRPAVHPLFRVVAGDVEPWERNVIS